MAESVPPLSLVLNGSSCCWTVISWLAIPTENGSQPKTKEHHCNGDKENRWGNTQNQTNDVQYFILFILSHRGIAPCR